MTKERILFGHEHSSTVRVCAFASAGRETPVRILYNGPSPSSALQRLGLSGLALVTGLKASWGKQLHTVWEPLSEHFVALRNISLLRLN